MARIIRAKLEGRDAALGQVAASDVARVILGLERALASSAYVALGKPRGGRTGRHRHAIEFAARLRFVGAESGSVIELLALAESATTGGLPLPVTDLSTLAFDTLIEAINSVTDPDNQLAAAVAQLAEDLGIGDRNDRLVVEDADDRAAGRKSAAVDVAVRTRMRYLSRQPPPSRNDVLAGTLVEADFERHTARLRTTGEQAVTVSFPPEMADEIHDALRGQAQFRGLVTYDPRTSTAMSVKVQAVTRADQLRVDLDDGSDFQRFRSFQELQEEQGIEQPQDPLGLYDVEMTDEEKAAFVAALAE